MVKGGLSPAALPCAGPVGRAPGRDFIVLGASRVALALLSLLVARRSR